MGSVLAGVALHSTVEAAIREAGQRVSPAPVDTRDLLLAVMRADESGRWSRIWLYAGDIEAIAGKIALDPANGSSADWSGIPLTDSCAAALDIAGRLAHRYRFSPLPVGLVVLGLLADESSAAAQILACEGLDREELLYQVQMEVLGTPLGGLDTILPGLAAEVRGGAAPTGSVAPTAVRFGSGNGIYCRICGSTPAAQVTFRHHQGVILFMRFLSLPGPFCRDCGLATYRSASVKSLWQGWWGPFSMFINGIVLLSNLSDRRRVAALPAPIPGAPGRPLDPGRPLYLRPAIAFLLVPAVVFCAMVAGFIDERRHDPDRAEVGDCLDRTPSLFGSSYSAQSLKKVSCSDPSARSEVIARLPESADGRTRCPAQGADGYYEAADAVLCVRTRK